MAFGMLANILIARFTKLRKYILNRPRYIIHGLYGSGSVSVYREVTGVQLVFTGALALGIIMVFSPAMCEPYENVTKNDSASGHFSSVGYTYPGFNQ